MGGTPYAYDGVCTVCGIVLFRMTRLGDEEISAMLNHLWTAHPNILREPETMVLSDLLGYIRLKLG